jgi:hypothetical protein
MPIKLNALLILLFVFFISSHLNAQSAYHGGKGDGYSSAEVKNVVLGIDANSSFSPLINMYPNPANSSQNLEIICSATGSYTIELSDITGRIMCVRKSSAEKTNIPLLFLEPGTYLVRIHCNEALYLRKLVILQP